MAKKTSINRHYTNSNVVVS